MNQVTKHTPPSKRPDRAVLSVMTVVVLSAAVLVTGCESMSARERGTATGAGVGAASGAVIGGIAGGKAGRGAIIGGAVGAIAGNLWSKHLEDKRRAIEQASSGTQVAVDRTSDNRLKVNVPSDVSFETGSATINPQMRPVLDEVGRGMDPNIRVTVVGHTDSTGSDAVNDPLSLDRAQSVRDYLSTHGVNARQITVSGRGSREPVATNGSDVGRAQNRRVEIFLSDPQA